MKKIIFKIKPLSKTEAVYLKKVKDRPSHTNVREIESKVSMHNNTAPRIRYTQGDGTCKSDAIKIIGANTDWDGVAAEYFLIRRIFQNIDKKWEVLFQEVIHEDKHSFDRLVMRDEDGNVSEIWFDITDWFGKW